MHAIQMKNFGPPLEVLELIELPEPSAPAVGEVLVDVEFAPINMNDLYLIEGAFPIRPTVPSVVGNEGVGRVLAVGRDVRDLRVGDRVLIPLYAFSWRERMVLPADGLFALPVDADPRQLSMLGINPPTAALLLRAYVDLQLGDSVAQNAANSGVGRSVIAIAKSRGLLRASPAEMRVLRPRCSQPRIGAYLLGMAPPENGSIPGRVSSSAGHRSQMGRLEVRQ